MFFYPKKLIIQYPKYIITINKEKIPYILFLKNWFLRLLLTKHNKVNIKPNTIRIHTPLSSKEITNGYTINSNSRDVSKYASKTISASSLKPLFLFKGNTPYIWGELAKSYASVLIDAFEKAKLTPGFSIYSKKDLSNSGLEFYAELFNAYFWSSEYRNLAQKTSPIAFDALIKSFSYVNE